MNLREQAERELELHNRVIKAAEGWSKLYFEDPDTHSAIIKVEARLERVMRQYFRELANERASSYINWYAYDTRKRQIQAAEPDFSVDVIVSDDGLEAENGIVMKVVYEPIVTGVAVGAIAGESIYGINLGMTTTSAEIQRVAKEQIANLVGKRLLKDGTIVDNPKAEYAITNKTRQDIRQSISTSLSLGETQKDATLRLQKTIKNPKRAAIIAQNEAVDAYQGGMFQFGISSGATGKLWQDIGAADMCRQNTLEGIIPIDEYFVSGHKKPRAHVGCRCGIRLIYPEEASK